MFNIYRCNMLNLGSHDYEGSKKIGTPTSQYLQRYNGTKENGLSDTVTTGLDWALVNAHRD